MLLYAMTDVPNARGLMYEKPINAPGAVKDDSAVATDEVVLDVTRLIWRAWKGVLPTGVDKVCLAYVDHFGPRARAAIHRKGLRLILTRRDSQRLFALLRDPPSDFRHRMVAMAPAALVRALRRQPVAGQVYLNVGHTGLDAEGLGEWAARRGLKTVCLVHDLIPVTHPEFCRAGQDIQHRHRIRNALASSAGVITNSRFTLDVLAHFAEDEGLTLPQTCAAWIAGHERPGRAGVSKLARPHFVTVGTIEGRKNHILLLRMWKRLAQRMGEDTPKLIVIGQRGWEAEHAIAMLDRCPEIQAHVREFSRASDDEVERLIAGACALLMPSFVEGFGMPVVEALQLGTPVIASDLPVFREIVGDVPTYIPSHDAPKWERTVLDFLGDGEERQRQLAAMAGYRAPGWSSHFTRVERFLQTL